MNLVKKFLNYKLTNKIGTTDIILLGQEEWKVDDIIDYFYGHNKKVSLIVKRDGIRKELPWRTISNGLAEDGNNFNEYFYWIRRR